MPLCRFSDEYSMLNVTPLENLFIDEFMLSAPGDYVKVYIYGLRQCYNSSSAKDNDLASFSRILGLEEKTVQQALGYWERQRLLTLTSRSPLCYTFHNIREVLNARPSTSRSGEGSYSAFNAMLQSQFRGRALSKWEYELAYDWLDLFHLPEDVIQVLVQYCIARKGNDVGFKYINTVANGWAEQGVNSIEAAEQYMANYKERFSGAARVLTQLGIKRSPTPDEIKLYEKWTQKWEFEHSAVIYSCRETTGTAHPNMKYLDKVLENMHSVGVVDKKQISQYIAQKEANGPRVKKMLAALGLKDAAIPPAFFEDYTAWINAGFKPDTLVLAAHTVMQNGGGDWAQMSELLRQWKENGWLTSAKARAGAGAGTSTSAPTKPVYKQTNAHYEGQRDGNNYDDLFVDLEES